MPPLRANRKKQRNKPRREKQKTSAAFRFEKPSVFSGHSVSVHTVTQGSRLDWIPHCFRMIQTQDYQDIHQWVIGNGSRTEEEAETLLRFLSDFFMNQAGSQVEDPRKFPVPLDGSRNEQEAAEAEEAERGTGVDAGSSTNGGNEFPAMCIRLADGLLIKILPWKDQILGEVRGHVNRHCTQKFIVSFDDDDIYPEYRVSLAVTCLLKSKKQVLGSSAVYLYDTNTRALIKFNKVSDSHATHLTLAYTKEYADGHRYGTEKKYAEEKSFLQNFKAPMYQLQPEQAVLQIVHGRNTFEKSKLMHRPVISDQMEGVPPSSQCTFCKDTDVLTFLQGFFSSEERAREELERVHRMGRYVPRHVTVDPVVSDDTSEPKEVPKEEIQDEGSDFAFYLGVLSGPWDPCTNSRLRGVRRAVRHLACQLAKQGYVVHVYGMFFLLQNDSVNCSSSDAYLNFMEFQGVKYIHTVDFPFQLRFKNLVLCGASSAAVPLFAKVQAERTVLDLFGEFPMCSPLLMKLLQEDRLAQLDYIFVKSKFQCTFLIQQVSKFLDEKTKMGPEKAKEQVVQAFLSKFRAVPSGLDRVVLRIRDRLLLGSTQKVEETGEEEEEGRAVTATDSTLSEGQADGGAKSTADCDDGDDDEDDEMDKTDLEQIFNCVRDQNKIPFRVVFVSDYSKGLARFLQLAWPTIRQRHPDAELHCYHGRPAKQKLERRDMELGYLLGQEGVIDHGAVSYKESLLARASARVQVAVHGGFETVDGVSVREAVALKCIPFMSGTFAYGERDGIRLDFKKWDAGEYHELAVQICSLLEKTTEEFDQLASRLLRSKLLISWRDTAKTWVTHLGAGESREEVPEEKKEKEASKEKEEPEEKEI
jgi:hypothetical protein